MAKVKPSTGPQMFVVTLGANKWTVEAETADAAITKVIAEQELKRDRRNFTARPQALVTKQEG
mgnify:CR=1 FL=1